MPLAGLRGIATCTDFVIRASRSEVWTSRSIDSSSASHSEKTVRRLVLAMPDSIFWIAATLTPLLAARSFKDQFLASRSCLMRCPTARR
ncbi:hypothetical protein D9M68_898130 [compost metagenome]